MSEEIERGAIPLEVLAPKRSGRILKWHERQWGSGFLTGVQVGVGVGIVVSVPIMFLAKWLVEAWAR